MLRCIGLCLAMVLISGCAMPLVRERDHERPVASTGYEDKMAETRELVKGILRRPDTASFSNESVRENDLDHQIIVTGNVEYQNRLGTLLQARYENIYATDGRTGEAGRHGELFSPEDSMQWRRLSF